MHLNFANESFLKTVVDGGAMNQRGTDFQATLAAKLIPTHGDPTVIHDTQRAKLAASKCFIKFPVK